MWKETSADGVVSKYLNRKLSNIMTIAILKVYPDISPNLITTISFIIGLLSAFLFAVGYNILGATVLHISSVVDGCDGEIARINNKESSFGLFYDAVLDRYIDFFVISGITYQLVQSHLLEEQSFWWILMLGASAILGSFLVSYTASKGKEINIQFTRTLEGRDSRLFVIFLSGLCQPLFQYSLVLGLIVISVVSNVAAVLRIIQSQKVCLK